MKLDISELLKKKSTEINFNETFDMETLERDSFILRLKSPVVISGRAIHEGDLVQVSGRFSVSTVEECSRCLEEFEYFFDIEFDETFSKAINEEDEELNKDDYYLIEDGCIVLDDMVMDQIILSMPVRFICNEECKGLCHECGTNLNKVDCDCEKETVNPKFAALKDLFKQDEEV